MSKNGPAKITRIALSNELTRGGLQTFGVNIVAVGLGFLAQLILARTLGLIEYGTLVYAITTVAFLLLPAVFGLDAVAARFIAIYSGKKQKKLLIHLLYWLRWRVLKYSVITTIASSAVLLLIISIDGFQNWSVMLIVICGIPFQAVSILRQGILRGFKKAALSVTPEGIFRPFFTTILVIACWLVLPDLFDARIGAGIHVLVSILAMWIGHIFLGWFVPGRAKLPVSETQALLWKSMAWSSLITGVANSIHAQADIWMLGTLLGSKYVGPYSAAAKYSLFVIFGMNAMNTMLGPMIVRVADKPDELQQLVKRSSMISMILGGTFAIILFMAPEFFLNFYGKGFNESALSMRILVTAQVLNITCGSVGMLLAMTGHHALLMKILVSSMILDIVLNAVFIPQWGMAGAAMATAFAIMSWNLLALMMVRHHLRIRPTFGGLF